MAQNIEDFLPPIQSAGLNTAKAVSLSGTVSISTATTSSTGAYVALSGTSTGVSGGLQTPVLSAGSTADLGIYYGSGAPTINAYQGSLYLNVTADAANHQRVYVRTTTTWVALAKSVGA